ncbi:MAG TPA: hypothetical protein VFT69_09235, partial [Pseudolabrys sp.]|nr:hypothetical protein [Pseudolabrys sp.]
PDASSTAPAKPTAFVGLPFVSREVNEYGFPKSAWCPQTTGNPFEDTKAAEEYAALAFRALARSSTLAVLGTVRFHDPRAVTALWKLLDGVILAQAKRRVAGGKNSRTLPSLDHWFLHEICDHLVRAVAESTYKG